LTPVGHNPELQAKPAVYKHNISPLPQNVTPEDTILSKLCFFSPLQNVKKNVSYHFISKRKRDNGQRSIDAITASFSTGMQCCELPRVSSLEA
jgi:hypothetical protein